MSINYARMPGTGDLPGDSSNPNSPDYDHESDERDDERAEFYRDEICKMPGVIAECCLADEVWLPAAIALTAGDYAGFANMWREAVRRDIDERIDWKADACGISRSSAARRLWRSYGGGE